MKLLEVLSRYPESMLSLATPTLTCICFSNLFGSCVKKIGKLSLKAVVCSSATTVRIHYQILGSGPPRNCGESTLAIAFLCSFSSPSLHPSFPLELLQFIASIHLQWLLPELVTNSLPRRCPGRSVMFCFSPTASVPRLMSCTFSM